MVSDSNNNRIQIFDIQGKYQNEFGGKGDRAGEFDRPWQLAIQNPLVASSINPGNYLLVADSNNDQIQRFNANNFRFIDVIGSDLLRNPHAVACSLLNHQVVAADTQEYIHLFSSGLADEGKQEVKDQAHAVGDSSGSRLLRSFGKPHSQERGVFCRVRGLCFDDERKRILACDVYERVIRVWSSDGSQMIKKIQMPANHSIPLSICMDVYHGNHFVVGTGNSAQVLVLDSRKEGPALHQVQQQDYEEEAEDLLAQSVGSGEGTEAGKFGTSGVCGVCVDEHGRLIATDNSNNRVQMF